MSARGAARARKGAPVRDPRVDEARQELLEGIGRELASSFPGTTRLGGKVVAALWLAGAPRTMDELAEELGCSKSNVFANVRALESAQVVERRRPAGARHDQVALRGAYPDVIVGAYVARLRAVTRDKRELVARASALLGDAPGPEADTLRRRLEGLGRKYRLFAQVFDLVLPDLEGPIDLERLLTSVPPELTATLVAWARRALAEAAPDRPGAQQPGRRGVAGE